jgi:hypothetical protein
MTEKHPYEAYGIRPGGSFAAEILGRQTEADAIALARHYAELWRSVVNLYRVPFINTGNAPWAADELHFVCRVPPRCDDDE